MGPSFRWDDIELEGLSVGRPQQQCLQPQPLPQFRLGHAAGLCATGHQLVADGDQPGIERRRHAMQPAEQDDLAVEVVGLDGAGAALQALDRGPAGAGQEISTRPFQLVTGRTWMGTAFGGARGRTDVPKIVDWYMSGKLEIDPMITHTLRLEDINKGFELMHHGESIRSVVLF